MNRFRVAPATILGVIILGFAVSHSSFDLAVTRAANSLHTGILGSLTTGIYAALQPQYSTALTLAISGLIAWRTRSALTGLRFGATVALAWLPVVFIKMLIHRPRPFAALLPHPPSVTPADWSFPSGHTAFVTALAFTSVLIASEANRNLARACAASAVVLIAAVVLMNGLHFPTDVLASIAWVLGTAPAAWRLTGVAADRLTQAYPSGSRRLERSR